MADNLKQQKTQYQEIKDLAKAVVALEKDRGNEVKNTNKMMAAGLKSYNKALSFTKLLGAAGKEWVNSIKDSEGQMTSVIAAKSKAAYDMRIQTGEVTTHTTEMAALQDDILMSMKEIGQLQDEGTANFQKQLPYQEKLVDLKNDLAETEELSADLMRDYGDSVDETQKAQDFYNTILQTGNKALIEKAKASWDTAAATEQAKKNAMDENKERKEASAQAIEYFEKAQIDKQVAEKRVELQEGMNELFGVSIKDVEKYGKKFQQFVNNPALIVMGVFAGLAAITKKFLISPIQDSMKLQSELGIGAGHAWDLTLASKEAAAGGFMYGESVEESLERAKTLVDTWGVLNDETMRSIKIATDLERTYGISTDSAAGLAQMMEATSDSSKDILMKEMAGDMKSMQDAGLPVGSIMTDIAGDTDFFAGHMKDGGKNIMKAAKFAKKLGMDMNTISSAAESLLDWESSINAEMEASVLLGREVNMEQARQLMFEGKHEEAMKAIMQQVGSEADFAAMNVVQREALASAAGVSLTDLTKMVAAEQKLANMSVTERTAMDKRNKLSGRLQKIFGGVVDIFREWYGRLIIPIYELFQKIFGAGLNLSGEMDNTKGIITKIKESMDHIIVSVIAWVQALDVPKIKAMAQSVWDMVVGAKDLAKWLWEHKTILIAIGTMWALNKLGLMTFVLEGTKGLIKMIAKMWSLKAAKTAVETPAPTAAAGGLTSFLGNPMGLVKAAGAMLIIAAAVWVFAKALQEFNTVDWASLPKAALALVILTAAMFGLGLLLSGPGALIFGAGVLGFIALGGALIILGLGLMSIGKGAKIVSELTAPLTSLVAIVGKIGLLAIGFTALGASLGALAIGAMLLYPALPALAALSALGIMPAGATVSNRTERNAEQRTTKVEKEIKKTNDRLDSLISVIEKQANHEALKAISRKEISAIEGAFSNK